LGKQHQRQQAKGTAENEFHSFKKTLSDDICETKAVEKLD
jgi:hypothetical protein